MFLSRVPRLPSLCSCTTTGAWMCFSAFSTTESSFCQRVKGGGGGWVGGHTQTGPSGKMGEALVGGAEWEESPGCQGVTSLDTTSSSPGNHCAPPPRRPQPPSSLLQLVNKTTTQKHLQWIHRVALKCIQYMYSSQNKAEQNKEEQMRGSKPHRKEKQCFAISNTHTLTSWCKIKICLHKQTDASNPE